MTGRVKKQDVLDLELYLAVSNGNEHRVRQYLQEGANPNATVDGGRSAFKQALWLQMLDFAELMIQHGADINAQGADNSGRAGQGSPVWLTAIYRDIMRQTTARTEFCIRHGADFTLPFTYDGAVVNVNKALDIYSAILVDKERAAMREVRRLIDRELAVLTRQRQAQMSRQRRDNHGRYRL